MNSDLVWWTLFPQSLDNISFMICLMASPCHPQVTAGIMWHQLSFKEGSGDETQVLILAKPTLYWLRFLPPQLFNTLYLNNPNKLPTALGTLTVEFKRLTNMVMKNLPTPQSQWISLTKPKGARELQGTWRKAGVRVSQPHPTLCDVPGSWSYLSSKGERSIHCHMPSSFT